jgi:hypothetical protein
MVRVTSMARLKANRVNRTEIDASQAEIFENPLTLKIFSGLGMEACVFYG